MTDDNQPDINANFDGGVSGKVNIASGNIAQTNIDKVIIQPSGRRELKTIPLKPPELLVGRDTVKATIQGDLADNHAVLIHGLGGMGKTALTATIGTEALNNKERYLDGVRWLTVLGKSLEDLCDDVLRDEGLALEAAQMPADAKPGAVRTRLGNKKLLVVLDDVDEDNDAARQWNAQAQPPDMPLLVTSRAHLAGFEPHVHHLEELDRADAVTLLRHYTGPVKDRLTDEQVNDICTALGNHPLAIEVTAPLLNDDPLGAPDLLAALGPAHQRIRKLALDGVETKDGNVYASMELSWARLDDDQRQVLARLAAFWSETTGDELLALASGLDTGPYKAARSALYKRSLTRLDGDQCRLHALTHDFVRAAVGEDVFEAHRRAAVDACVAYVVAHQSKDRSDYDKLDSELHNLLSGSSWAMQMEMYQAINIIAGKLWGCGFLSTYGYDQRSLALLTDAAKAAELLGQMPNVAVHLNHLANSKRNLGLVKQAIQLHEQALKIAEETADKHMEASIISNLGIEYSDLGEYQHAVRLFQRALEIRRSINDLEGKGNDLGNLGICYRELGEHRKSIDHHEQAIRVYRSTKNAVGEGRVLCNASLVFLDIGAVNEAVDFSAQALDIALATGDRHGEGNALAALGLAHKQLGQAERAIEYYEQALEVDREIGKQQGVGIDLLNLGLLHEQQGSVENAVQHIEQARAIFADLKSPHIENCDEALARLRSAQ